jgi:hypothetical protein
MNPRHVGHGLLLHDGKRKKNDLAITEKIIRANPILYMA